jgi:calcineurin-like phosphoesterase family protein
MSQDIWFTADTHFGHKLMSRLRGHASIEEMDEAQISSWNAHVKKGDMVYVMGDMFWNRKGMDATAGRLNGTVTLVKGNHDSYTALAKHPHWGTRVVRSYAGLWRMPDRQRIFMGHYAQRTWQHQYRDCWHFYGHSHANLPEWEWTEGRVYNYEELREKMQGRLDFPAPNPGDELRGISLRMPPSANADREVLLRIADYFGPDHHTKEEMIHE